MSRLRVVLALAVIEAAVGGAGSLAATQHLPAPLVRAASVAASTTPSPESRPLASGARPAAGVGGSGAAGGSAPGPAARRSGAFAYDPTRAVVILFGGQAGRVLDDTWEWDGARWTQANPAHHPSARSGAAMAFDSQKGQLIMFGGQDASGRLVDDTWRWDGSDWAPLAGGHPPARSGAGLVYDPSIGLLVLFGGVGAGGQRLHDTWIWGGEWSALEGAGSPLIDVPGGALVYDARAGRVLLVGGSPVQTWGLLAARWSDLSATLPPACAVGAAAYDSVLAAPVLAGSPGTPTIAMCVWSGHDWQPQPVAPGAPPARRETMLAFDDKTTELVLFGGPDPSGALLGDTWTWTPGRGWSGP